MEGGSWTEKTDGFKNPNQATAPIIVDTVNLFVCCRASDFKGVTLTYIIIVVFAPSVSKVNCYPINNNLPDSKLVTFIYIYA